MNTVIAPPRPAILVRARQPVAPTFLWSGAGLLALFGLLTPNPLLTAACVLVVPFFVQMLWRAHEPPVLLFLIMYQWLQVATKVFHADVLGVPVERLANAPNAPVVAAILLGLASLLVLALGQLVFLRTTSVTSPERLAQERGWLSSSRLFWSYAGLVITSQLLVPLHWIFLPVMQALIVVENLRWIPLFLLGYVSFVERRGRPWLLVALVVEILLGFGGYFSGFKTVFFVLILAALTEGGMRLRGRRMSSWIVAGAAGVALFGLVVVWQGIKHDYRVYLNQGTRRQVVLVTWPERLAEVVSLASSLDGADLRHAVQSGFERMSYVDYFADALAYVPERRPHSDGAIWGGAVRHVLTPRILFPEKPVLPSDSELTMRYTGRGLASDAQGTSIGLGYVAESYVDFGMWLMVMPVFLMGLLQGWIYRYFLQASSVRLIGYGFGVVALLPGLLFETSALKYLGGTLYMFIVLGLLVRFVMPRTLPWVSRVRSA